MLNAISKYWNTLRWLRPVQVFGRLWFRLYRPIIISRRTLPARVPSGCVTFCAKSRPPSPPGTIVVFDTPIMLGQPADWQQRGVPKLYRYNLHYFEDLAANNALAHVERHRQLVHDWIDQNPLGRDVGWDPYPTSLRLVNWAKWSLAAGPLGAKILQSYAVQARWLSRRIEFHLLANHLWTNAKALIFAGAFLEGQEPREWLATGLKLSRRELHEQILPDGGHFERSPMYHAIALEDLLDLIQLSRAFPATIPRGDASAWADAASRMLRWLRTMCHPDGEIAFFNDAAFGIAPGLAHLEAFARRLQVPIDDTPLAPVVYLQDSGYARLQIGEAVLLVDVAPIAPDYQPGHSHADTLSFELSVKGRRVLVNGGTSTYEPGEERLRQRSTAAHNTVCVDDENSSEVWSSFRVARRARVTGVHVQESADMIVMKAAHDGYLRLGAGSIHAREWRLEQSGLQVLDHVSGSFKRAEARFRFAPGWTAICDATAGKATSGASEIDLSIHNGSGRIAVGTWHPQFAASEPAEVLCVGLQPTGHATHTMFRWGSIER